MTAHEARHAATALSSYLHEHDADLTLDARLALMVLHSTINQIDPPTSPTLDHQHAALVFRKASFGDD